MSVPGLNRRDFLAGTAAVGAVSFIGQPALAGSHHLLTTGEAKARLAGGTYPETPVWAYNGAVPGPELRVPQGQPFQAELFNQLADPTTIHWHGVRLPNGMDGVAHLTQAPVSTGENFTYSFTPPDAGTYWYHPHNRSAEQVGRGLYGALVVEEERPIAVDRDLVWVLDDWRLDQEAKIAGAFGAPHDLSHAGRIGNTVTINGAVPDKFEARPGERIRLRLINAANARFFSLNFRQLQPAVVGLDGQPVAPHAPPRGLVTLAPSQRMDLILDMTGEAGDQIEVTDDHYPRRRYHLINLMLWGKPVKRTDRTVAALPDNLVPEPDLEKASRHTMVLGGGAMDPAFRRADTDRDALVARMRAGGIWSMNGKAIMGHSEEGRLFHFGLGEHVHMAIANDTAFDHPIHMHGHHFRVLSRNGRKPPSPIWRDTVVLKSGDGLEIAFVADNPGKWMLHCHILEHQMAGMTGWFEIS